MTGKRKQELLLQYADDANTVEGYQKFKDGQSFHKKPDPYVLASIEERLASGTGLFERSVQFWRGWWLGRLFWTGPKEKQ